jgi:hypothetical protein
MGEETGKVRHALLAGAVAGAGSTLLAASLIPAIMGGPAGMAVYILAASLIGGTSGAVGTLIGALKGRKAKAQDQPATLTPPNLKAGLAPQDPSATLTPQPPRSFLGKVRDFATQGFEKVKSVTKSLVEKHGAKAASALAGAGIGAALGGPVGVGVGAIIGAVSGLAGTTLAEKMNSLKGPAPFLSKLKGAATSSILSTSGAALMGAVALAVGAANPALGLVLGSAATIGALTGVSGTLSGSKLSSIRDGGTGGFMAGMLTNAFTGLGGPLSPLTASIGSAVGARASTNKGKAVLGALAGAALGAATGAFGGPVAAAAGAAIGAGLSALGAVAGPKLHQGIRNLTEDMQKKLTSGTDKLSDKVMDVMGTKKGLITLGALAGAIGSAPMGIMTGLLLGPLGAVLPSVVGGILGGIRYAKVAKNVEGIKNVRGTLERSGPTMENMRDFMCDEAFRRMEQSMTSKSKEDKERWLEGFRRNTLEELKKAQPQIDEIRTSLSSIIFKELKDDLSKIKDDTAKAKFLEERIGESRQGLTQLIVGELVSRMAQKQEPQQKV